jgi:hypothetical protein
MENENNRKLKRVSFKIVNKTYNYRVELLEYLKSLKQILIDCIINSSHYKMNKNFFRDGREDLRLESIKKKYTTVIEYFETENKLLGFTIMKLPKKILPVKSKIEKTPEKARSVLKL